MTTVLQYLVIAAVIGLVLFGIALLLFGRGEQMAALPARTSPAQLPDRNITGTDVRKVRFALAVRGYRMSDVDWTLDRLADELDRTREQLAAVSPDGGEASESVNTELTDEFEDTGRDSDQLVDEHGDGQVSLPFPDEPPSEPAELAGPEPGVDRAEPRVLPEPGELPEGDEQPKPSTDLRTGA